MTLTPVSVIDGIDRGLRVATRVSTGHPGAVEGHGRLIQTWQILVKYASRILVEFLAGLPF